MISIKTIYEHLDSLEVIYNELCVSNKLPKKVDGILVGGSEDSGVAIRAAQLYRLGIASKIVISGYKPSGMKLSEAKMLSLKCIDLGVPKSKLFLEEKASNTGENVVYGSKYLPDSKDIVLIHKPYATRRFLATAEAQWQGQQPVFYVTHEEVNFEDYIFKADPVHAVWMMLGDFLRMETYFKKGFQSKQIMSNESKKAYKDLAEAGFVAR